MEHSATYSPEDNKLRLYPACRLDAAEYAAAKSAGFRWAPRQELFVAPRWTPAAEDYLLGLCGEIGDEDTSLVERAEERAERFEDYSEKRAADAESARAAVSAIADNIPLGQPILVGHHSERHARKDAERIENGMRRAVKMWETSQYWTQRAAGAIRAAKYKELPAVRARRIKGLEADERRNRKTRDELVDLLTFWAAENITRDLALKVCNYRDRGGAVLADGERHWSAWSALDKEQITVEELRRQRLETLPRSIAHYERWLAHYANRLTYERAMLADAGGTVADRTKPEKGGACRCWASEIRGGWLFIQKVNKVSVTILRNWGNGGKDFTETIAFDKLYGVMAAADVQAARVEGRILNETSRGFCLAPPPTPPEPTPEDDADPHAEPDPQPAEAETPGALFGAMKESLRQGVQVVSAPQLFPTPWHLAARCVDLADIGPGHDVLEPSAGTGQLLAAIRDAGPRRIVAVEINSRVADILSAQADAGGYGPACQVLCADFLGVNGELGTFARIVMNPPFENAQDIEHIRHARAMLNPGGRLVAICANGPRQRAAFMDEAREWIDLPTGSFAESGTNVNAAIVILDAE